METLNHTNLIQKRNFKTTPSLITFTNLVTHGLRFRNTLTHNCLADPVYHRNLTCRENSSQKKSLGQFPRFILTVVENLPLQSHLEMAPYYNVSQTSHGCLQGLYLLPPLPHGSLPISLWNHQEFQSTTVMTR